MLFILVVLRVAPAAEYEEEWRTLRPETHDAEGVEAEARRQQLGHEVRAVADAARAVARAEERQLLQLPATARSRRTSRRGLSSGRERVRRGRKHAQRGRRRSAQQRALRPPTRRHVVDVDVVEKVKCELLLDTRQDKTRQLQLKFSESHSGKQKENSFAMHGVYADAPGRRNAPEIPRRDRGLQRGSVDSRGARDLRSFSQADTQLYMHIVNKNAQYTRVKSTS